MTPNPQKPLSEIFAMDARELVTEFIADFDLKYEEEDAGLSNPLIRWLDFTSRYIRPGPRRVLYSNRVVKSIVKENRSQFKKMISRMKSGVDLNPYQSKGLTRANDTSGKKKQRRTDQLFAHWGIHHLHLTKSSPANGAYFSERSSWLLFCIVGDDFIGVIDVRHHDDENLFSDPDLIRTVARSWPDIMEPYHMKSVTAVSGGNRTASEVADSRKAALNTPIEVDGKFYLAPRGVTMAFTPIDVTSRLLQINRTIEQLGDELSNPASLWREDFTKDNLIPIDLHLALHADGLCIHDKASDRVTLLPRNENNPTNPYEKLHNMLLPTWAHKYLLKTAKTV